MANASPEQDLIERFVAVLRQADHDAVRIQDLLNANCHSKTFADVEFTSASGQRWALEAKSGKSSNCWNEPHELFGKLMRETGRDRPTACNFGVLLPHDTESFFRDAMRNINRCKFIRFGSLIPVAAVFVFTGEGAGYVQKTWAALYDDLNPD